MSISLFLTFPPLSFSETDNEKRNKLKLDMLIIAIINKLNGIQDKSGLNENAIRPPHQQQQNSTVFEIHKKYT